MLSPANHELAQILLNCVAEQELSELERQQLAAQLLATPWQLAAFPITTETVNATVDQRIRRVQHLYPNLQQFCQTQLGWHCPTTTLWNLWLPLAEQLLRARQKLDRPLIQGILGGQGTGKTTLTLILTEILRHMGLPVCRLSIDDLYKTYAERQRLQQDDPRFRWRGPPGTHDVELGLTVLKQLQQTDTKHPIAVPRFDKSLHGGAGDRAEPEWVNGAEVILFEGWFIGVRPIDPQRFTAAPSPIKTAADRAFARQVNEYLQTYLPLWDQLDRLWVLYPSDYRLSQQWRRQAEQQMIASGRSGMNDTEVNEFVEYFWCALHPDLFIQPLLTEQTYVDLVIEIDPNHQPSAIYCPGTC